MGRARPKIDFDRALSDLPAPLRWREYMMRVEAVIFAASQPVSRETLSALIGSDCNLDLLITVRVGAGRAPAACSTRAIRA